MFFYLKVGFCQAVDNDSSKFGEHFTAINPIKPFIGLPNLHYEYQFKKGWGITAFSEVLAYDVIKDFNHPDMVNTLGFSYYPFLKKSDVNQGIFFNLNISYLVGFDTDNSLANGIQMGYKWLMGKSLFLEPKLLLNYQYNQKAFLPGLEVLMGIRF